MTSAATLPAADRRQAELLYVLATYAKKRADRDALAESSQREVRLTVRGTVGNVRVCEKINGTLHVGTDSSGPRRTAAPSRDVVAYLLSVLPKALRERTALTLANKFSGCGSVPETTEAIAAQADWLLAQLHTLEPAERKGSVRFNAEG